MHSTQSIMGCKLKRLQAMPKTTFKVRQKSWTDFNVLCRAASLRRDDFLNRVLPAEIELLNQIPPCDDAGERWLKRTWVDMSSNNDIELIAAPVLLSDEVVSNMNEACQRTRVPRDAFLDCAIIFLAARLRESVLVLIEPRRKDDIAARLAEISRTYGDTTDSDIKEAVYHEFREWSDYGDVDRFNPSLYKARLSFDKARVDEEKEQLAFHRNLEAFAKSLSSSSGG